MKVALIILATIMIGATAWSYAYSGAGPMIRYAESIASREPVCGDVAVGDALRAIPPNERNPTLFVVRVYRSAQMHQLPRIEDPLLVLQRAFWINLLMPESEKLSTFCAAGWWPSFNMVAAGRLVGLPDLTRASPAARRALAEAYADDMRVRHDVVRFREVYAARLAGRPLPPLH
jgi:hypothetical protein